MFIINKNLLNKIYKEIKKYDNIVIARHIGPDPDAIASQLSLRDSIRLTFPSKKAFLHTVSLFDTHNNLFFAPIAFSNQRYNNLQHIYQI